MDQRSLHFLKALFGCAFLHLSIIEYIELDDRLAFSSKHPIIITLSLVDLVDLAGCRVPFLCLSLPFGALLALVVVTRFIINLVRRVQ